MKKTLRLMNFHIWGLIAVLGFMSLFTHADEVSKQILMVVTSHGEEQGQKRPGYEFDEFAKAYLIFKANNIQVDIASPLGGPVVADKYDPEKPFNKPVLADADIMKKLNNTLKTSSVNAADYDGVFVIGGKGAMFDLPKDKALQSVIADIYQNKGTVGAVCHGPAALVNVKLSNDQYLVAGKSINGFTNNEEALFGKKWAPEFEFQLEDKLKARGARFESSDIMLSHVAVDERLITGQNPTSTTATAQEFVRSLGVEPVAYESFDDEKTLALVAGILENEPSAYDELAKNKQNYQLPLIGMYGFYYLSLAETKASINHAITLMESAQSALNHHKLDLQIVKGYQKLGNDEVARNKLKLLLKKHPDFEEAKSIAAELL